MKKIKSLGSFELPGRGTVFTYVHDESIPRETTMDYWGPQIEIDGRVYDLKGVESFAVPMVNEFGFLVSDSVPERQVLPAPVEADNFTREEVKAAVKAVKKP